MTITGFQPTQQPNGQPVTVAVAVQDLPATVTEASQITGYIGSKWLTPGAVVMLSRTAIQLTIPQGFQPQGNYVLSLKCANTGADAPGQFAVL
jgi:hypothetical protein